MNQLEIQRELAAFDEKITLAELEVSKAEERVRELKYQKARFQLDVMNAVVRENSQRGQQPTPETNQPRA